MRRTSLIPRLDTLEARTLLRSPFAAPSLGPPPAPGPAAIWVNTAAGLQAAVRNVQSGQTIVIEEGTYDLTSTLFLGIDRPVSNVTIRGATDDFNDVVIRGRGMENPQYGSVPHGISVYNAQDVTIANLSVGDVYYHPIDLQGGAGAERVRIYHVRVFDGGEQLVKSNAGGDGVDDSSIEYSLLEYTAGPPTTDHGGGTGYTGGLHAHQVDRWVVRHNIFRNFHTPDSVEHWFSPVVLMWNRASDNVVEGNTFINCDRAVAFGLIDIPGNDHQGGIIRNNFVYVAPGLFSAARQANADGQLLVYDSPDSKVYHNTVITNGNTPLSIEVRWATTGVEFRNNLTDAPLGSRDGGIFSASGNYTGGTGNMFVDPAAGDFHLVANAARRARVVDKADLLADAIDDWDDDARPSSHLADIGADEYRAGPMDNDDTAGTSDDIPAPSAAVALDSGGGPAGPFAADAHATGGSPYATSRAIDTADVADPAPQAVYQTERYGNFTYTIPGLTPGGTYRVRLHFAEIYWNGPGLRRFDVAINGATVLGDYDIVARAGGAYRAVVESFTATADDAGMLTIRFTTRVDNAKSSGIEVIPVPAAAG